jgi:hypothetical protein
LPKNSKPDARSAIDYLTLRIVETARIIDEELASAAADVGAGSTIGMEIAARVNHKHVGLLRAVRTALGDFAMSTQQALQRHESDTQF